MLDNNRLPVELGIPELADIDDQDLEEEADVKTSMDGKAVQLAIELLAHGYAKRHVSGDFNFKVTGAEINVSDGRVLSATCQLTFTIPPEACNTSGAMFGGNVPCITDIITTCLLIAADVKSKGEWVYSTTMALNSEFVRPSRADEEVIIQTGIEKYGKIMIFTYADYFLKGEDDRPNPRTGLYSCNLDRLLYRTRHQKYVTKLRLQREMIPTNRAKAIW
eukprot:CAMPEP_0185253966 /NCGR_PEP_ID=MMETSP1359-20130426/2582_1 /TAXON_ID=552665 /ORGANISM="Bigelowiella longifila, Strain CCMP242" /LENGTH=219 /DNA_ID=CAMNT_0027836497 /DNA_START=48 /DNA_END=704 /DNA_ORIENTATION=-